MDLYWNDLEIVGSDADFKMALPDSNPKRTVQIVTNDPYSSAMPIIVITSSDSEKDGVRALPGGATDFIRKPYHWQIIKHRVKSIISMRKTAAMYHLMKHDQLTGLYSREYFYKAAAEEVAVNSEQQYDIICCDIENFSLINDSLGYEAGNDVLKATAGVLSEFIPGNILCSRMNSDIFALLVPSRGSYHTEFFDRAVRELNRRVGYGNIVVNFGIYHYADTNVSIYTACNRALSVLDKIKNQFTSIFALYDDEFHKEKLFAQRITANMEKALDDQEFIIHYQPKFDLNTERMLGAEALVRWSSSTEGFMPPGKFIPLFEKNGFITELDKYVWEEACRFLRNSIDNGLPLLPISVNVSRQDLYSTDVARTLVALIDKYNLKPEYLHLEITESAYNEHPERIIEITKNLHDLGFILEMDDFGTGYSSLNMLSEMTLDVLKLDIRFAHKDSLDRKQNEVLSSILDLAKRINLVVISEGVETLEQADNLRNLGCDQAQGYYFSRPITSAEYVKLLGDLTEA